VSHPGSISRRAWPIPGLDGGCLGHRTDGVEAIQARVLVNDSLEIISDDEAVDYAGAYIK
jgi:hypothetical protein